MTTPVVGTLNRELTSGDTFKHFKNNKAYTVRMLANDANSNQVNVVYKDIQGGSFWTRPIEDFNAEVMHEGKRVPRFKQLRCTCSSTVMCPVCSEGIKAAERRRRGE